MRKLLPVVLLFAATAFAVPTRIEISKLRGGITIDGELSDSGWETAYRVDGFVEYYRADNVPAPARTLALLTYDQQFVYVAFRADDPNPRAMRAPFVDRDKVLGDQDWVAVLLDTQNDRRSSMNFRVNPRGIQTDSVTNDATGTEDFSPDFFYEAVARPTATGWAAEMRIPLSTLRYPPTDPQTWGIMLLRNYPRDYRYIMSNTPIPKGSSCFICHAADLTGLQGLPTGGQLTLAPYMTAQRDEHLANADDLGSATVADPLESDIGLDLKWNPSAKLTIDGTLNPDFSQIESDVPRLEVNNRFAVDYPEKRAFFLEGVDLLSTPIRAVYTRTITSPAWGARATGKAGETAYTLLVAEDRGGGSLILPGALGSEAVAQDFRSRVLIGRARRNLGTSFVGALATAREIDGGGYNRVAGPDFLWKPASTDRLTGQLLFSDTRNPDRRDLSQSLRGQSFDGHAAKLVYYRDVRRYDIWASYHEFSPGFRADDGFVPQVGFRRAYGEIAPHIYPKRGFASFVRPYFAVEQDFAYDGGGELRRGVYPGFYFRGKWGSDGWMTFHVADRERVRTQMIATKALEFSLRAAPFGWLPLIQLNGEVGQRIDYAGARRGRGGWLEAIGNVRPTDHLELQLNVKRDWLDLRDAQLYLAQLERLKLTYTFSSRSLVRLIGQRNDLTRNPALHASDVDAREGNFSTSALYGYKLNWQTVFFVGYGDDRLLDDVDVYRRRGRSVFTKVSYAFQK